MNLTIIGMAFTMAVLLPLTITWCIRTLRRPSGVEPNALRETNDRLNRIETAVDSIALEVERISEGQRFVTKVMNERMLGAGAAQPIVMPAKEQAGVERR